MIAVTALASACVDESARPTLVVGSVPTTAVAPDEDEPSPITGSSAAATSTTGPTTVLERHPVVIAFGGDVAFTDGLDRADPLGAVVDVLSAPDFVMVNLETAVAEPGVGRPPVGKPFLFRSPPVSLELLVDAGVDGVLLGNNHVLDFGRPAVEATLAALDAAGLVRVGAGLDPDEAYRPTLVDVGSWRIGVVSLSRVPCDWSAADPTARPEVAWACAPFADRYRAAIAAAVEAADVTVVAIHGGEEGVDCPSGFMVELAREMAALGVEIVVNGHPHVVQGIERRDETWIVHSTGNFAFPPARGLTADTALFRFEISEEGITPSLVPLRAPDGVMRPATEAEAAGILDRVAALSDGARVGPDGSVTPDASVMGRCSG